MTVPAVSVGRGAWTNVGRSNGSRYYAYSPAAPVDGSFPDRDVNWQAVHLGVEAIQSRVNAYGYSPALVVDGKYGSSTAAGVKWAQKRLGFPESGQDGVVGPTTAKALWHDLLIWFGGVYHVPASQLYGFMMLESIADPGAVGVTTPTDRGLFQINMVAHPEVSVAQAFDPAFATDYTAKRLGEARIKYSGKTVDLKNRCAIAQHNTPVAADIWYRDGVPPLGPVTYLGKQWAGWPNIEKYVNKVLEQALQFKA